MEIEHPVLGKLSDSKMIPNNVEGIILFNGRAIPVRIDPDDRTINESIEFASAIASALSRLEPEAKSIVVRDLRPLYNDGWNEYDEVQNDGSLKTIKSPKLSDAEFAAKLTLNSISIMGNECLELWYDDSGMFWGHGVLFSSLDGMDFSKAHAELSG